MRNFYLVFKQSFRERVTSKSYLLTTFALIMISIFAISLPSILENFSAPKEEVVVILNTSDIEAAELEQQLSAWRWKEGTATQMSEYKKDAEEGKILGLYVIDQTSSNYSVNYFSKTNDVELNSELSMYLQTKNVQKIALNNGLSEADQQALFVPVTMEKGDFTAENEVSVFVTYLMLMFILMAIMMYGTTIATGVASEKASRVMEVMVTKVNPLSMIFGKIFGIALASLVQFTAFFGGVALYLKSGLVEPAESLGNFELNLSALTVEHCVYFFIFFLLGYLLYASLYAVFGSMVSRPEELNGTTMPISILLMASAFSGILFVMDDPTSALSKFLALFPFTSPFNMIILVMKDAASLFEITISIGLLVITTFVFGYFAAKIYPKGILHFGENLKLRQLIMRKS
ncbi:ABC transporter permease [Jeotgalibacillus sp. S-D1]|uniref:ABC transporter permease n=1 Tax=Jeotgalibacillus sp. S-D1 TaxID=2552189 RepID=UPI00105A5438|nr:ABC transporter permease [Jeotgalibacillus sp. S-D1]TDL31976.1 ABC transporter permease [Jeotgalibacillus sp. S-D1]